MVTASSRSPCRVRRSRPIQTRHGARRCSCRSAASTSRSSSRRRAGPLSRATSSSITTSACRSSIPASATATPASRTAVPAPRRHWPIATAVRGNTWLRSAPGDTQALRVDVTDKAGNRTSTLFTFKVQFVVAPFALSPTNDAASALFANTPFAQRASLYSTTVAAVEYPFTNTTGKAFFLRPSDNGVHGVDNLVDWLVRENQMRLKTTTEWRAGFIKNQLQLDECPSVPKDDAGNDKWTPVTQILNNIGTDKWVAVKEPDASVGALQPVTADNPLPPAPSAWSQLADFDNIYGTSGQVIQPGLTLFYEFDYILNIPSVFRPAAVRNWRFVDNTSGTPVTKTCHSVNFLQQRQSYGYLLT